MSGVALLGRPDVKIAYLVERQRIGAANDIEPSQTRDLGRISLYSVVMANAVGCELVKLVWEGEQNFPCPEFVHLVHRK